MTTEQANYIDSLLLTASISEERKQAIENYMFDLSEDEAELVIENLLNNQLEPLHYGLFANQTQIKKALENL